MSPEVFLMGLRKRGFELHVDGAKLHCRGTLEPLNTELLAELKSNKPGLIRILADESQSSYKPQLGYKLLPLTGHIEQPHEPYLNAVGDLVIPFDCEPKYQWWVGGQSIRETKEEIRRALVN